MRALLGALWQSDTAFPSGGFAFSNGVEAAVATLGVLDRAALTSLIGATLVRRWAKAERPAILYAFHAESLDRLGAVDAAYEAATLSEPLRLGSRRNGRALLKAHKRLGSPGAAELGEAIAQGLCLGHLPAAQGWIWRRCGLGEAEAVARGRARRTLGGRDDELRIDNSHRRGLDARSVGDDPDASGRMRVPGWHEAGHVA